MLRSDVARAEGGSPVLAGVSEVMSRSYGWREDAFTSKISQIVLNKSLVRVLYENTYSQGLPRTYGIRIFGEKGLGIRVSKCTSDDS